MSALAAAAETVLRIEGMQCASCAATVERALGATAGVLAAHVDGASGWARVRWQPRETTPGALRRAVEKAGFGVREGAAQRSAAVDEPRRRERRLALWRLFVAGFCMMQVMMYATPAYVAAPGEMSADIDALLRWASWLLTIPVVAFSAGPWFAGAWRDLRARRIGMDVPVALGIALTFAASTGATFAPGGAFGSETYFDSLTMFVFFLLGGRWLEMRARHATLGALDALTRRVEPFVERLRDDGGAERVPVARLVAGDRVRVRPGQAFAADGRVESGSSTQVDEALLTGESRPLPRGAGEKVLAGSINLSSPVVVRVERVGADTRYAQIVALVERAALERPALVQTADRIARPFLGAVVVLAAIAGLAWSFVDPAKSVPVAVAVLVVTCPCALSLAAPAALLAAAGALARRGVLVRRLGALEGLARADVFAFDKTGTLTEDRLAVARVDVVEGAPDRWLAAAAALARASLHPASRAVLDHCGEVEPALLRDVVETPGEGVEGVDDVGRRWRLGSARFAGGDAAVAATEASTFVSVDGRALAVLRLDEVVRPAARAGLDALRTDGADVMLLTGDRSGAAQGVARALGIVQVRAGASPEDKLAEVTALQAQGRRVAMVGDGINDAPVLARADVSVAMGQGADLARAHADLTLLSGDLADLAAARRLAGKTLRVIRENLAWAALYNAASVPLALAGWLPPWAAGLGMATSSLVVVLNAQRLRRLPPRPA